MEEIKFVKNGIFYNNNKNTIFIKYDTIYSIGKHVPTSNGWGVCINFIKSIRNNDLCYIHENSEQKAIELRQKIIQGWMSYHDNFSTVEEKLDKLLSHIEVLPGGEEYEKAKTDFEKNK